MASLIRHARLISVFPKPIKKIGILFGKGLEPLFIVRETIFLSYSFFGGGGHKLSGLCRHAGLFRLSELNGLNCIIHKNIKCCTKPLSIMNIQHPITNFQVSKNFTLQYSSLSVEYWILKNILKIYELIRLSSSSFFYSF